MGVTFSVLITIIRILNVISPRPEVQTTDRSTSVARSPLPNRMYSLSIKCSHLLISPYFSTSLNLWSV